MIQITPHKRILVAKEPLDLRKGIDGTAAQCRNELEEAPFTGKVFVFRNRARTMIRILVYDGQGFLILPRKNGVYLKSICPDKRGRFHEKETNQNQSA